MKRILLATAATLAAALVIGHVAHAQESAELLPGDAASWINSPPLSAETLKGKGVFLWFYEEQCPNCPAKWPGLYELAKKYEHDPIVFIAVNSGNSRGAIEQYAKSVDLAWPTIVDTARQTERRWFDKPISLENIHQVGLILPSGQKTLGQWNDLEASVQKALQGASWKVDPKTVPSVFLPTWKQVEQGKYAAAAPLLKKGLATSNAEVKEAATRIHAVVQDEMQRAAEEAAALRKRGNLWGAYRQYESIATTFAGLDLPAEVAAAQQELAASAQVQKELEAAKALEAIKKTFPQARTEAAKKRVIGRLEQFARQHAETEAADEARQILDQAAANRPR